MHCAKIAKRRIMQLTPDDSAGILVFSTISAKFQRGHPQRRCQIEAGRFKSAIFDQYLAISQITLERSRKEDHVDHAHPYV